MKREKKMCENVFATKKAVGLSAELCRRRRALDALKFGG